MMNPIFSRKADVEFCSSNEVKQEAVGAGFEDDVDEEEVEEDREWQDVGKCRKLKNIFIKYLKPF